MIVPPVSQFLSQALFSQIHVGKQAGPQVLRVSQHVGHMCPSTSDHMCART